jgi:excisionase family DNA binding protein
MTLSLDRAVFNMTEACTYLRTNRNLVVQLLRTGELSGWRTQGPNRGDWRISRAACDEWIAQQEERGRKELAL